MIQEIQNTLTQLQQGKTILYPTDTVWGLGCDIFNQDAVKRIYQIKKREDSKALILLVSDVEMLSNYVEVNQEILDFIKSERPTTIIYFKSKNIPSYLLATDGSVAIRVVKDKFCKQLIHQFGKPIVSTSANISGQATPRIFAEIEETILHDVDYVVNWRREEENLAQPSRILKMNNNGNYQIIRE